MIHRVAVLIARLAGVFWFVAVQRARPEFILILILGYFTFISALFHITRSGRINLPLKVLVGFFAAWMLARGVAAVGLATQRPTSAG